MDNYDDRLYSTSVRAGRRTYFFDLKKTRSEKPYVTITESKKFTDFESGDVRFEKHRIFLFEEDFEKFSDALKEIMEKVKEMGE
jgi:hypothetical protein